MGVRLFCPGGSLNLPLTTVAANVNLSPLSGTQARICNVTSNEAVILLATTSTVAVQIPVSTSASLNGMCLPGNSVTGIDLGGNTWISGLCPVATATTNLRITMGEGG